MNCQRELLSRKYLVFLVERYNKILRKKVMTKEQNGKKKEKCGEIVRRKVERNYGEIWKK